MRCILCVRSYLLLDGWTDLHETLRVYKTQPRLLHGVFFHFRSERQNRKLTVFQKPEVKNIETGSRKVPHAIAHVELYKPPKFYANRSTRLGGDSFAHIKCNAS